MRTCDLRASMAISKETRCGAEPGLDMPLDRPVLRGKSVSPALHLKALSVSLKKVGASIAP